MKNIKLKKVFYIVATMFLGWLLSMIAHDCLEVWHINKLLAEDIIPLEYHFWIFSSYLPSSTKISLMFIGLIGGYLLGQRWWYLVYVKKWHWWRKK